MFRIAGEQLVSQAALVPHFMLLRLDRKARLGQGKKQDGEEISDKEPIWRHPTILWGRLSMHPAWDMTT